MQDLQTELRADEAAARLEVEEAERVFSAAEAAVPASVVDADPDEVRRRALAVEATRSAAVIESRTLGPRPDFDEVAEQEVLAALRALDSAGAATAAVRRQTHAVLAVGNVLGLAAIGHATVRVVTLTADPVGASVALMVIGGGALPVAAMGVAGARVLWAARRSKQLKPALADGLRAGGCESVRELADRRDAVDRWDRRARLAADAADRCAAAVHDWHEVAGVGADTDAVDDLLARAEWCRVARAAVDRAGVAHRIAAARLARVEESANRGDLSVEETEPLQPASERIQIALLRLRRGARLSWRRAS